MKIKFYPIFKILRSEIPNCLKNYLEPCAVSVNLGQAIPSGTVSSGCTLFFPALSIRIFRRHYDNLGILSFQSQRLVFEAPMVQSMKHFQYNNPTCIKQAPKGLLQSACLRQVLA